MLVYQAGYLNFRTVAYMNIHERLRSWLYPNDLPMMVKDILHISLYHGDMVCIKRRIYPHFLVANKNTCVLKSMCHSNPHFRVLKQS
jgi:hypothetical protein